MDELVEGMLPIGSRLSPNNGASGVVYFFPVPRDIFPVGFHVSLLKVGGEAMHVLVIGQQRV